MPYRETQAFLQLTAAEQIQVDQVSANLIRLAARAADTSLAMVDNGRGTAFHGFPAGHPTKELLALANQLMDRAHPERLVVICDTHAARQDGDPAWPDDIRFVACSAITAISGRRLGFICVMDPQPRRAMSAMQMAGFVETAELIQWGSEQGQRYKRLVELTERAARTDQMLRSVLDAASCEDALTGLLSELCTRHGATIGRIWKLQQQSGTMHEISRFADDGVGSAGYYRAVPTHPVKSGNSMTAEAIQANKPLGLIYSELRDRDRYVLMQAAIDAGLRSQVSFPIWVQDQRFGVSLAFTTERTDLDAIISDIEALSTTLRPALFRKVTEDRIRYMAHHDELTHLSNRALFNETLQKAVATPGRGEASFALIYLDLDGFKAVNDTRGHDAGDKLLSLVAARLRQSVRSEDMVARIGGDEFAIIQYDARQPTSATQLAQRLLHAMAAPFDIDDQPAVIGVSIGIAFHPSDGQTSDVLQRNADAALYEAKHSGRNTFRLFEHAFGRAKQDRLLIERDLKLAIERQELTLAYQPIRDARTLNVRGLEALLRWMHPTRGALSPVSFVPMAEASGLVLPLGAWVLKEACSEAVTWARPLCLSVNFSPMQFRQPRLPYQIEAVLSATGLPGHRLDLEVTEGLLLEDSGTVLRTMHELREQGIRITLDDFGTAYASLSYLRRFPFDRLKIDKSFTRAMCGDDGTLAIVEAILSLSHRLGLQVVAEGVETPQELEALQRLDCHLVQGFLTGRPMTRDAARAFIEALQMSEDVPEVEAWRG